MTIYFCPPHPYYHPTEGWLEQSQPLTPEQAGKSCRRHRIPYAVPTDSTPDYWHTVLKTSVAGTYFIHNSEILVAGLKEGDVLQMEREDNPHDPNAIRLSNSEMVKIGYIPRKSNEVIARLMEINERFRAVITGFSKDRSDISISVQILRGKMVRRHFSKSVDCLAGSMVTIDALPVRRNTCRFVPQSDDVRVITYRREFTEDERWDLSWGHRSYSMDDRWNFYAKGNRLYISRSWSGHCIFILELGPGAEHKLIIENDQSRYSGDDENSLEILDELFNHWLAPITLPRSRVPLSIYGNVQIIPGPEPEGYFRTEWDGMIYL